MFAILKKEFTAFFSTLIGYLVITLFLLANGLFLWIFKGDYNIFNNGYADLSSFFYLSPWVILFLIPAITMRSFSDELKQGTIELLLTKPLSTIHIILGKYFGALSLIFLAIIPTFLYVVTLWQLGNPLGNIDLGSVFGFYIGLLLMSCAFAAIGVFASSLSSNQLVAFIVAVFLCFLFCFGFEKVSQFHVFSDMLFIEKLGIKYHFKSLGRGVIDTRNIIYFISLILFFGTFTFININKLKL